MKQQIFWADEKYLVLQEYLVECKVKKIFLVCGSSFCCLKISNFFDTLEWRMGIQVVKFQHFSSNPQYDSIVEGVQLFRKSGSDFIIAVGGGSAMDVAKCIKLYSNMNDNENYLQQQIIPNKTKLLVIPTTAGTGSEATKYAVIYFEGEKQSVSNESCIPQAVLFDAKLLQTLPGRQRKATMLDAFCHAVESYWSINSTEQSRYYSKAALRLILENWERYLYNDENGNREMLYAANLAGKAINITQTTAGHAMCYKLTGVFGLDHGHAAALCVSKLWLYMIDHCENCIDFRGEKYLRNMLEELAGIMGRESAIEAAQWFEHFIEIMDLPVVQAKQGDIAILKDSVNEIRLRNHPIKLNENAIEILYRQIFQMEAE